jgi:hypothetical protein
MISSYKVIVEWFLVSNHKKLRKSHTKQIQKNMKIINRNNSSYKLLVMSFNSSKFSISFLEK